MPLQHGSFNLQRKAFSLKRSLKLSLEHSFKFFFQALLEGIFKDFF